MADSIVPALNLRLAMGQQEAETVLIPFWGHTHVVCHSMCFLYFIVAPGR